EGPDGKEKNPAIVAIVEFDQGLIALVLVVRDPGDRAGVEEHRLPRRQHAVPFAPLLLPRRRWRGNGGWRRGWGRFLGLWLVKGGWLRHRLRRILRLRAFAKLHIRDFVGIRPVRIRHAGNSSRSNGSITGSLSAMSSPAACSGMKTFGK